ncbi:MAG: PGF-CTERM sorting domain-containing protein, partial [Thermoplasmata archaeon]|nr:PGF-CTERM sorting domain-containing protein [Thermoplasmata archaeon]
KEVEKGKKIVFTVTAEDEEGDEVTVTWKDGDKVLGTGSPFEYGKLGAGKHTITVVVDDGTGVTEETFDVTVTEESPGVGIVAAFIAMVLASLVALWRRVS